ncbi:MAG: hypothetical protein IKE76_05520, partial [Clostridia bacterium]|nr:hypothetical protein [Clostridia bacterium]
STRLFHSNYASGVFFAEDLTADVFMMEFCAGITLFFADVVRDLSRKVDFRFMIEFGGDLEIYTHVVHFLLFLILENIG